MAGVAAAVLFGAAFTVTMSVLTDLGFAADTADFVQTVTPGLGFWLVLAGGVIALAATVLVLLAGPLGPDARPAAGGAPPIRQQPYR
jgi:hypothetical protein